MNRRTLTWVTCMLAAMASAACDPRHQVDPHAPAEIVLRRGNGGEPQTLDPALAEDTHAFAVLGDLYEGLLTVDSGGDLQPGAAESWDISADGRIYTFRLRGDARWSNGQRVTSQQFANGFRRALDPSTGSSYGFLLSGIENAGAVMRGELSPSALGVTAVDESTLVVRLASPSAYFLAVLSMPIAFPLFSHDTAKQRHFSNPSKFTGNGPFLLEEWQPGRPVRLRKNHEFHDADGVTVDVVEYFPISDPFSELNMFRAGELDLTATVPTSLMGELRDAFPDELRVVPSLGLYYIALDITEAPLDNARLRKALSMAIDRDSLVAVIGRGEQPAYGLVPDGVAGYTPSRFAWQALGPDERLQQARRLYASAGFSAAQPLQLTLMYDAGDIHETIAVAVSAMWREVLGVQVKLDKREWKYFLATRERRDDWQAMRFAWTGDYNHPSTFTDLFHSHSRQNLPGYANPAYDALLLEAAAAGNAVDQMRLLGRAEEMLLADNPVVPLYFYVSKHLVSSSIAGFQDNVMDLHPSRYIRFSRQGNAH